MNDCIRAIKFENILPGRGAKPIAANPDYNTRRATAWTKAENGKIVCFQTLDACKVAQLVVNITGTLAGIIGDDDQTAIGIVNVVGFPAHAPSTIAGTTQQYDANGNMLLGGDPNDPRTIAYDIENRPITMAGQQAQYDGDGARVRLDFTKFMGELFEDHKIIASKASKTNYYFFNGVRIANNKLAVRARTYALTYYHGDQLNSANTMTDQTGLVKSRAVITPYGRQHYGGGDPNIALAGQRLDGTGLYHMGAREMNPSVGMFVTPDPSSAPDPERPQTLNRYAYANNNPINMIDPTGYESVSTILDNAEADCTNGACAVGVRFVNNVYKAATLGFASIHDPMRDAYDQGEATGEEYVRVGIAGGSAAAIAGWFGGKWIGEGIGAVGSRFSLRFPKGISTPYGTANQSREAVAVAARAEVERGSTLYRLGTRGKSEGAEAQFWSLEHPSTPGYIQRYGIPKENVVNLDFMEAATLKPGTPFVTRIAPPSGTNPGGGIEAVVPKGGVEMKWFSGTTP